MMVHMLSSTTDLSIRWLLVNPTTRASTPPPAAMRPGIPLLSRASLARTTLPHAKVCETWAVSGPLVCCSRCRLSASSLASSSFSRAAVALCGNVKVPTVACSTQRLPLSGFALTAASPCPLLSPSLCDARSLSPSFPLSRSACSARSLSLYLSHRARAAAKRSKSRRAMVCSTCGRRMS